MAAFQTIGGTTNWSLVVLALIVPFVLGFICALLFVRDTNGKSMDQLANEATGDELSGTAPFAIMLAIVVILFSLCIVCPLAISGWSKLPIALPLMATSMLLPFAFFFIFGGKTAGNRCGKEVSENPGTKRLIEPKRSPSLDRASALCVSWRGRNLRP